jgi:hypothetical protein
LVGAGCRGRGQEGKGANKKTTPIGVVFLLES